MNANRRKRLVYPIPAVAGAIAAVFAIRWIGLPEH